MNHAYVGSIKTYDESHLDLFECFCEVQWFFAYCDVALAIDNDALQELFKDTVGMKILPVHRR